MYSRHCRRRKPSPPAPDLHRYVPIPVKPEVIEPLIKQFILEQFTRPMVMRYSLASARNYVKNENFKDGMVHYLIALTQKKHAAAYYAQEFVICLQGYAKNEPRHCLKNITLSIQTLFKNNCNVLHELGTLLIKAGMKAEAYKVFEKAIEDNKDEESINYALRVIMSNLSTSVFDSWHIIMLNNKQRNTIYGEAIRQIKEGKLVLEIGSGTGILSVLAHWNNLDIIAVEESEELVAITRKALEINEVKNGKMKEVLHCNSTNFDILTAVGRRADVVIAEIFDCAAFGEGIVKTFLDAHERLTNADAVFIPSGFTVFATLVQCASLHNIHAWQDIRTEYVCTEGSYPSEPYWCDDLHNYPDLVKLSEPFPILELNLMDKRMLQEFNKPKATFLNLKVIKDGQLHAIVVHWHADMGAGLLLDSSMEGSCWDHGIFPTRNPITVKKGKETQICVSLNFEGKRLDICVADELEKKNQDLVRTVHGQYLNMCHDLGFTKLVENDVKATECKIFASNPFNWKDSEILKTYLPYPYDCPLSIENAFHPTLLLKVGAEITGLLEPPFDRLIFWPFFPDGGLNDTAITTYLPALLSQWKEECEEKNMVYVPPRVTPDYILCHCQLIFSNEIAKKCRLQPECHLGIDLKSPNHPMGLFECRDLYINKLEHKVMSEIFQSFGINFQAITDDPTDVGGRVRDSIVVEVVCTEDGEVDGILYWWKGKTFESRNQPSACFVFDQRIIVQKGQTLKIRCDLYACQMLMTLEPE